MLQRKQTLFLLLAAVCGGLTFLFPITTYVRDGQSFLFRTTGLFLADGTAVPDASPKVPFAIVIGLISVALVVSVFLYKTRSRQILFVRSTYVLLLAVIAFLFITDRSIEAYLSKGGTVVTTHGLSLALPIAMMVLAFLAERGIRQDEALVKSADRLR